MHILVRTKAKQYKLKTSKKEGEMIMLEQLLKGEMNPGRILELLNLLGELDTDDMGIRGEIKNTPKTFLEIDLECQIAGEETRRRKLLSAVESFVDNRKSLEEKIAKLEEGREKGMEKLSEAERKIYHQNRDIERLTNGNVALKSRLENVSTKLSETEDRFLQALLIIDEAAGKNKPDLVIAMENIKKALTTEESATTGDDAGEKNQE